jgi:putative flippase GtrA
MGNIGVAALAGFVVPFVVSFLKNTAWSAQAKQIVSVVVCLAVAFGITVVDNGVNIGDWKTLLLNLGVIFTVAQVFYQQYFGGTSVNAKLDVSGVGAVKAGDANA